jgi:carbohydrate-selective porin OprB
MVKIFCYILAIVGFFVVIPGAIASPQEEILKQIEEYQQENSLEKITNTDQDASFHFEAFYQYQITDNIGVTPGIILITSPNGDSNNDSLIIGTIRTTFSF